MKLSRVILWLLYGLSLGMAVASFVLLIASDEKEIGQWLLCVGSVAFNVCLWTLISVVRSTKKLQNEVRGNCFVCGKAIMMGESTYGRIGGGIRHPDCNPVLEKVE